MESFYESGNRRNKNRGSSEHTFATAKCEWKNIDVVITKIDPNNELRWLGRFDGIPGLFDGEHICTIESVTNNNSYTHFIQREVFKGILVPFFAYQLDTNYTPGFNAMNHALKTEAERASI